MRLITISKRFRWRPQSTAQSQSRQRRPGRGRRGAPLSPLGRLGQPSRLSVVHKEDFLSKVKVAVARPLPDEVALWRGDTQAIQGDVHDFGLANRGKNVPEGRSQRGGQQYMLTWLELPAAGFRAESLRRAPRLRNSLGWPCSQTKATWRGPLSSVTHICARHCAGCWADGRGQGRCGPATPDRYRHSPVHSAAVA